MNILISDYQNSLNRDIDYEINLLKKSLPNPTITVVPYEDQSHFLNELRNADGLLTAFIPVDDALLAQAPNLKCISLNSTGYNFVDLTSASKRNITVCAIREYCTLEVAEFAFTLLLSLIKKIKYHQVNLEEKHLWQYDAVGSVTSISGKTLGIYGLGRIGQALAKMAQAFHMNVVAVDPYLPKEVAEQLNIPLVDSAYIKENADFISNHMNATQDNACFFNEAFFKDLKKKPYFINVARGACVDEDALLQALDLGYINGAGLDVLTSEMPDLATVPFLGRDNVILTPHAAFYSEASMKKLQDCSCSNLIHYFNDELQLIDHIVNG